MVPNMDSTAQAGWSTGMLIVVASLFCLLFMPPPALGIMFLCRPCVYPCVHP